MLTCVLIMNTINRINIGYFVIRAIIFPLTLDPDHRPDQFIMMFKQ